jgi:uncharacterized protein DUF4007
MRERIGLTFHEKLQLSRSRIAEILSAVGFKPGVSNEELRSLTSLGTNMTKAFPRLAQGCGLLTKTRHLTELGSRVIEADPGLDQVETMWAMHFNLVRNGGPGPEFWSFAFRKALRVGQPLSIEEISDCVRGAGFGAEIQASAVRDAVSRMIGFYVTRDGLAQLELVTGSIKGGYECTLEHSKPPLPVFAYMVADCWEADFASQLTVELDQFEAKSRLADILRLSPEAIRDLFRAMADAKLCDLYLAAPPYQIVKAWDSVNDLTRKLYGAG